jgi:uncharacterized protein YxeA
MYLDPGVLIVIALALSYFRHRKKINMNSTMHWIDESESTSSTTNSSNSSSPSRRTTDKKKTKRTKKVRRTFTESEDERLMEAVKTQVRPDGSVNWKDVAAYVSPDLSLKQCLQVRLQFYEY